MTEFQSFSLPPAGIATIWPPNAIVLAALLLAPAASRSLPTSVR